MSLSTLYMVNFFRPDDRKIVLKGQQMFDNNYILRFEYRDKTLRSAVQSSHKDVSYAVEIEIDTATYTVLRAYCTCKVGKTRCSHMAATLLYATKNLSKTSAPLSWLKKPKTEKHKISAVQTLDDLLKQPSSKRMKLEEKVSVRGKGSTSREVIDHSAGLRTFQKEMEAEVPNYGMQFLFAAEASAEEVPLRKWKRLLLFEILQAGQTAERAREVLRELVLSTEEVNELSVDTIGQTQNILYCAIKKFRLTSTKFHHILNIIRNVSPPGRKPENEKTLEEKLNDLLYPANRLDGVAAIDWGRTHEKTARLQFQRLTGFRVQETGIFLDKETGCIGASPDGLVGDDAVLEIKCLYSLKNDSIGDKIASHQKSTSKVSSIKQIPFLRAGPDNVEINPRHTYYDQIQGQLHLSGRSRCYLFLWSPVEPQFYVVVKRDPSYLDKIVQIQEFYFREFIPHILKAGQGRDTESQNPAHQD